MSVSLDDLAVLKCGLTAPEFSASHTHELECFSRVTLADVRSLLEQLGAAPLRLEQDDLGTVEKSQTLVGACYDEGPYWSLAPGDYLVVRLDTLETPDG